MGKRLYRVKKNHLLGGVCTGFADYFNVDVTLIRLILILLFLAKGIGILFYIICWIIIPLKPDEETTNEAKTSGVKENNKDIGRIIIGIVIILIGVFLLFLQYFPFFGYFKFWPLLLVILGIIIILKGGKNE